ncbi:ISL3 family transposase [Streptomyces sp. NPDC056975]|uniref:ISL3 family transposase n=1 Tax=Streptomyces sp. NPDC056975 TaxID=3345985 RepID=UPI00362F9153
MEDVTADGYLIVVRAFSRTVLRPCSVCGIHSRRVHSRYERRISDRPVAGRSAVILLTVRRFCCVNSECERRTFVEQVDGVSERYRQASTGLRQFLYAIAAELGGRPGSRLCRKISVPAGRMRLLQLLHAPPVSQQAPRVLGVDEFAFRRGCTYGTILVDVEKRRPIDVLPDRTSETLASWLVAHPGVEIVCRDRASAYTRAIREAAPHALELADRWHLLRNLSQAVEKICQQHRSCLRKYAEQEPSPAPGMPLLAALPPTLIVQRVQQRYEVINRMLDNGYPLSEVARRVGLDRKTARRYRDTELDVLIASARDRRNVPLDRYKPFLQAQFASGTTSAKELYDQICVQGFQGGYSTLSRYVQTLRNGMAVTAPAQIPSPRVITAWIMRPRDDLSPRETAQLDEVRIACPDITEACNLARSFTDLVRYRRGAMLALWIREAEQSAVGPIRSFGSFLRQDLDAVTAGLSLPWSSGVVEGHVNRVKTLKRAMYGRASFDLLRTRILITP